MDLETPVDGWYVWVGAAIVSVTLLAFVLGFPSQPPPDATKAVNTIDRVAGSTHEAAGSYEHDAAAIQLDTRRITMRNDAGTSQASVAFGPLTPVTAVEDDAIRDAFERLVDGQPPEDVVADDRFDTTALLAEAARTRDRIESNGTRWRAADGVLRVRKLDLDGETLVLVHA